MNRAELIKANVRSIKDFPKKGIIFRDITTAIKNKDALKAITDELTDKFKGKGIDYVAGIEARGFVFASALANNINAGCILIRKPGKLPAKTIEEEYTLEYGTDKLQMHEDAIEPGKNVIVTDDLLATGGTAAAACRLLKRAGANVKAAAFVIELTELEGRKIFDEDIEVISLVSY